jgi:hypothetical protein
MILRSERRRTTSIRGEGNGEGEDFSAREYFTEGEGFWKNYP